MQYFTQYNFNKNEWKIFCGNRKIFRTRNINCYRSFMKIHFRPKHGAIGIKINDWCARIEIERTGNYDA